MNNAGNTTLARLVCDEADGKAPRGLAVRASRTLPRAAVAAFEGTDGRWNVEVHFEDAARRGGDAAPDRRAPAAAADVTFETIAAKDWVAASLADLKPVTAGRFTVHGAHDRATYRAKPDRHRDRGGARLRHRPSRHHARLPAGAGRDREATPRPRRMLDIGTGTGVLAIAAAKALRVPVLASDIDPEAVRIARENARLNGVAPLVECLRAAGLSAPRFRDARAVRPGVRQYPAGAAQAAGRPDAAAARAGRARRAVRIARRAGERRACRLPAARAEARAAHSARRMGDAGAASMIPKSGEPVFGSDHAQKTIS